MSGKGRVLALALAVTAVAPASANAGVYTGTSSQSLPVKLTTRANGRPRVFQFAWTANCQMGVIRSATRAYPGSQTSYRRFTASGRYVVTQPGGIRATVTGTARGRRVSAHQWRGSYTLSAVVRRNGQVIDRCRLGRTGWRALRPR
jgi:hypothetical protein